jgi:hypothetical protein
MPIETQVIWYPSGQWIPLLHKICELRDRGFVTVTADLDEQGQRFYEIGPGVNSPP